MARSFPQVQTLRARASETEKRILDIVRDIQKDIKRIDGRLESLERREGLKK